MHNQGRLNGNVHCRRADQLAGQRRGKFLPARVYPGATLAVLVKRAQRRVCRAAHLGKGRALLDARSKFYAGIGADHRSYSERRAKTAESTSAASRLDMAMISSVSMEKYSVMVIEDDARLADLVSEYLEQHEFNVNVQPTGESALENFTPTIDLVILDLMMPGIDGLSVCRSLRERYDGAILMLTAKGSDIDQVVGLEIGADDYVVKPIEPRVLLARARALLRRKNRAPAKESALQFDNISVSKATQQVLLDGSPVPLTTQEFDLLWLLVSRAGEVMSRAEIYQSLRGLEYDGLDRTVDVCVSHLRKKLRDDGEQPAIIKTVWGKGYLFAAQQSPRS